MRRAERVAVGILAVIGATALIVGVAFLRTGLSAKKSPPALEVRLAKAGRHLLVPAPARRRSNPVPFGEAMLDRARAHFADHCATCHGNDGRGDTPYGRNLSPRAPDMTTAATQDLTDGELFYFIENGIKLTGMPAFGAETPESERESWELVHFIRHLPQISGAELEEMKRLNPISPADLEQELAAEAFLRGGSPTTIREHPDAHQN